MCVREHWLLCTINQGSKAPHFLGILFSKYSNIGYDYTKALSTTITDREADLCIRVDKMISQLELRNLRKRRKRHSDSHWSEVHSFFLLCYFLYNSNPDRTDPSARQITGSYEYANMSLFLTQPIYLNVVAIETNKNTKL